MARRAPIIKRKIKAPRKTRNEQYMVNLKYLGDEPTKEDVLRNEAVALNWYGSMCDKSEARDYLKTWMRNTNRSETLKLLPRVSDTWLPLTACWLARIITNNPQHPRASEWSNKIDRFVNEALKHLSEEKVETPAADKPSIQDRIKDRVADIIGDVEALIDSGEEFSLYDWLTKNEIPAMHAGKIAAYYGPWLDELLEASESDDEQLKQAYKHLTKKQMRDRIVQINKLIEDAERYGSNTKKIRKARTPRPVSVEKKLKHFRYQKESGDFKIASVSPEKVIGAQELWAFNTKYKTLTVFRALDRGGLDVNRSSITKYDEATSHTYKTGRKPEQVVDKALNGGKIILRKLTEELKKDPKLAERINENTILLKVVN